MLALNIPVGQFVGGLVEACLWLSAGVYLAWVRPLRLRRSAAMRDLDDEDTRAKLRKVPPQFGFVLILIGAFQLITGVDQAGVWQLPKIAGVVLFLIGVAGAVYAFRQMRRANQ